MKRLGRIAIWLLCLLLLAGCWDIKNIQDINYVTCVGLDYTDNGYKVYVQLLDFSTVAKTESGKPNRSSPVWVGSGEGETLIVAFNDLYRTSQLRLFYGQINSVVMSERLIEHGLADVWEMLNRYYELRYTPWVFGTRDPLDQLLDVTPFFNLSPLISLLHQPLESYGQQSYIAPITVREFVTDFREPGSVTLLPSISMTTHNWKSDRKPQPLLDLNGIFVFQQETYKRWFDRSSLIGLRWMDSHTYRSPLLIRNDKGPIAVVSLENPKVDVTPHIANGTVTFDIEVKLAGYLSEKLQPISETELKRQVELRVEEEIRQTYLEGRRSNIDMYRLEHALYLKHVRQWKQLKAQDEIHLTPESLQAVKVSVKLNHSGKIIY
ncbi:MAG: Ger(x)C family spore germination protein [Paenibacillus sp.]|jgi:Ger(x)C family germination protein|nr:Ger(x)C family spore germination protein [Paenibacillus sp.]